MAEAFFFQIDWITVAAVIGMLVAIVGVLFFRTKRVSSAGKRDQAAHQGQGAADCGEYCEATS